MARRPGLWPGLASTSSARRVRSRSTSVSISSENSPSYRARDVVTMVADSKALTMKLRQERHLHDAKDSMPRPSSFNIERHKTLPARIAAAARRPGGERPT